jgi:hypothetical protein
MLKWFKRKQAAPRALNTPMDLQIGDMLQFEDSFSLPADVRGESFSITRVSTYDYQSENEFEFTLEGPRHDLLYLSVSGGESANYFTLSREIPRATVESLFDTDALQTIFDDSSYATLTPLSQPEELTRWLGQRYDQKHQLVSAYFYERDCRNSGTSQHEDDSEEVHVYSLEGEPPFSLYFEIWADGETSVYLSIKRPLSDISDYYPGS